MLFYGPNSSGLSVPSPRFFLSFFVLRRLSIWLLLPLPGRLVCFYLPIPQPVTPPRGGRIGAGSFPFRSFLLPAAAPVICGGARVAWVSAVAGSEIPVPYPDVFGSAAAPVPAFLILMRSPGCWSTPCAAWGPGGGGWLPCVGQWAAAYVTEARWPVAVARWQVWLLANARELQQDLRRLGRIRPTASNSAGLQKVLQEPA